MNDAKALLIIIGYNYTKDIFELILVALLSHEDTNILIEFYNFIINTYNWEPKILTFDFAKSNINAIKEVFKNNNNIKLIPCFFHLLQIWWRKASSLGLRKKRYIKDTKLMFYNLQLIPFMSFETAKEFYSTIVEKLPKNALIVEEVDSEEDCQSIDFTAPDLTVKVVKVTNESIMVNAYARDSQSKIIGYTFQIINIFSKINFIPCSY